MIIQFKDRKRELKEILKILNSNRFEFLIIYGRRRIGKTALMLKAIEKKNYLYYFAMGERDLERFYEIIRTKFPEVEDYKIDWITLFKFLKNKVDGVIIDEIQNIIKEDKTFLSKLQFISDNILNDSKFKLILIGSSISTITSMLSYSSSLYGRRTASFELKPIKFFDLNEFFPNKPIEELVQIYGFADGIPYYLIKIKGNFWDYLSKELKSYSSFLKDEIDFLMRYEFDDPTLYKSILEAIAFGKTKIKEIKDYLKIKRTDITPYLKNLINVKLIKREVPITLPLKSRYGQYFISDNFINFWFRFIYPNLPLLESGNFNVNLIKKNYNAYLGHIFEKICFEYITEFRPFNFTRIGRWWHKDKEIDIVAINEFKNEILFAECKWKSNVNAKQVLKELKEKAKYVQWNIENRKEKYAIFAKSFKVKTDEAMCVDLREFGRRVER